VLIGDQACYLQIEKSTNQLEHEEEVPSSQPYPILFEILRGLILEKPSLDPLDRGRANQQPTRKQGTSPLQPPEPSGRGAFLLGVRGTALPERSEVRKTTAKAGNERSGTAVADSRGQEMTWGRFQTNLT
jgi:hypothetical protein